MDKFIKDLKRQQDIADNNLENIGDYIVNIQLNSVDSRVQNPNSVNPSGKINIYKGSITKPFIDTIVFPTVTAVPIGTSGPTGTTGSIDASVPTDTLGPIETSGPTDTLGPTGTLGPTDTSVPTDTLGPIET